MNPERVAELMADPDVVVLVAQVGAISRQIGYQFAEDDMARRWRTAAERVRRVLAQPTFAELQRRRGEA